MDMDDFIQRQGPAYLAHLLGRLHDELVRGAEQWYPDMGVTVSPRATSILLALDEYGPFGVTGIAALLRKSHPLVINWIRHLQERGFVEARADPFDGRRSIMTLTRTGKAEVRRLRKALRTMALASQSLMDEAGPGLYDALWRMEQACREQPFAERLRALEAAQPRATRKASAKRSA